MYIYIDSYRCRYIHIDIDIDLYTPIGRVAFRCRPLHHGIVRCIMASSAACCADVRCMRRVLESRRRVRAGAAAQRCGCAVGPVRRAEQRLRHRRLRNRSWRWSSAASVGLRTASSVQSVGARPNERPRGVRADQRARTRSQRDGVRATCSSADGGARRDTTTLMPRTSMRRRLSRRATDVVDGLSTAGAHVPPRAVKSAST